MSFKQWLTHLGLWLRTVPGFSDDDHLFIGRMPNPGDTDEYFTCLTCGAEKVDVSETPMYGEELYMVYVDSRPLKHLVELIFSGADDASIYAQAKAVQNEIDKDSKEEEQQPHFLD